VMFGTTYRNLELAWQMGKFRVESGPLPDDFAPGPTVFDLERRNPGELVGGGVAYAVAAGLDCVHFHFGKFGQYVRHLCQLRPVELNVLPCGKVAVALVVMTGNVRELAQ